MLEPLKYLVQPVAVERDDRTGRLTREVPAAVLTVYDADQAADVIHSFEASLHGLAADLNGGMPMPVEQTAAVTISCDNPGCAGMSDLDPADRHGWTFVTREVYGKTSTQQCVYCCAECEQAGTPARVEAGAPAGPPAAPVAP